MEKKRKIIDPISLVLFALFIVFFIVFLMITKKREKELERNKVFSYALIVETYFVKSRSFARYEYWVQMRKYVHSQEYDNRGEPINIGDSCEFMYAATNPDISRLLKDDKGFLKIKKKVIELPADFFSRRISRDSLP